MTEVGSARAARGGHNGNIWFGGGAVPDTHVVGKPYPTPATATGKSAAVPSGGSHEARSQHQQGQAHYHDISGYLHSNRDTLDRPHRRHHHSPAASQRSEAKLSAAEGGEPAHYHQVGGYLQSQREAPASSSQAQHRYNHSGGEGGDKPAGIRTPPPSHKESIVWEGPTPHYHDMSSYLYSQQRHGQHFTARRHRGGPTDASPASIFLQSASPIGAPPPRCQTPPARWDGISSGSARGYQPADLFPISSEGAPSAAPVVVVDGVPRGSKGVDAVTAAARAAQRQIENMQEGAAKAKKQLLQRQLREALDQQIQEKANLRMQEWKHDAVVTYGPGIVLDDSARRVASKQQHRELQAVWSHQAAEAAERKAAEDAYYKPQEENWNDMQTAMERMRRDSVEDRVRERQASWLDAWKEHQATEGAKRKAAAQDRQRWEQEHITAPNILNYSDRILLAEQQRRESQREYGAALDAQTRDQRERQQRAWMQEYYASLQSV